MNFYIKLINKSNAIKFKKFLIKLLFQILLLKFKIKIKIYL